MQLIKLALLFLLCSANGCASRNSKNASTVNGALFGAAAGATIGEHNNSPLSGALIGATTGAIAGNIAGDHLARPLSAYEEKFQADQKVLRPITQQPQSDAVTIEQLLRMTQAGVEDDIIVGQIQARGVAQILTTDEIIYLTRENVSPVVIKGYQAGKKLAKPIQADASRIKRSADHIVVERRYHHGYSPNYYPPTRVTPRTGIYFGLGN